VKLTVLVPVFNEIHTIEEILRRVRSVRLPKEIIVVDDASTDGSRELLTRLQTEVNPGDNSPNHLKVILQPMNQGKGAAIGAALPHVTGDIVIIQDADLEYDPDDYLKLLEPILAVSSTGHAFTAAEPTGCSIFGTTLAIRSLLLSPTC
jgi:glycosyltransferase involved in cell wall biosynthesis